MVRVRMAGCAQADLDARQFRLRISRRETAGAACTRLSLHALISRVKPASLGRHARWERRPVFGL